MLRIVRLPNPGLSSDMFTAISPNPSSFSIFVCMFVCLFVVATQCTHSPYVPSLSQSVHSGRRMSFGRRVWFSESHIILVISFCFIYSFCF